MMAVVLGTLRRMHDDEGAREFKVGGLLPPNETASGTYTQPSHPIKPPAGRTPSPPTNQTASWTHTQPSYPINPPAGRTPMDYKARRHIVRHILHPHLLS